MFRLFFVLILCFPLIFSKCIVPISDKDDTLCGFKFFHKLNDEQQKEFAKIFGNKNLSLAEMDEQLEEWAETLTERTQNAFDAFWDQIWDAIDEFRDYGDKVHVSDDARSYVEKFMDIISDDDTSQNGATQAMLNLIYDSPKSIRNELLLYIKTLFTHIKPRILRLLVPKLASIYRGKDFF